MHDDSGGSGHDIEVQPPRRHRRHASRFDMDGALPIAGSAGEPPRPIIGSPGSTTLQGRRVPVKDYKHRPWIAFDEELPFHRSSRPKERRTRKRLKSPPRVVFPPLPISEGRSLTVSRPSSIGEFFAVRRHATTDARHVTAETGHEKHDEDECTIVGEVEIVPCTYTEESRQRRVSDSSDLTIKDEDEDGVILAPDTPPAEQGLTSLQRRRLEIARARAKV